MKIIYFVFGFLYVRNWYTGEHELSRPRIAVFAAALFLIMLGFLLVSILQAPIEYTGSYE